MLALTVALALVAADAVGEGALPSPTSPPTPAPTPSRTWTAALGSLTAVHPERSAVLSLSKDGAESRDALANAQDDYGWEDGDEEDSQPRLFLTAWGGEAFDVGGGDGHGGSAFGGEVSYALGFGDLGLWGSAYKIRNGGEEWAPIALLRLTNRFATGRGFEAAFTFGVGAGRPADWRVWFQVALGLRLDLGPMFLAGELSFEQEQLLRLSGGVGVKL